MTEWRVATVTMTFAMATDCDEETLKAISQTVVEMLSETYPKYFEIACGHAPVGKRVAPLDTTASGDITPATPEELARIAAMPEGPSPLVADQQDEEARKARAARKRRGKRSL